MLFRSLYEKGNSFIIHLTPALQACFNVPIATVDDLPSMIIDHVYVLDKHECLEYQQNFVSENLSILLDDKLIYDDPLSLFWVAPILNFIVYKNSKITYTWQELVELFYLFCTSQNNHIIQCFDGHVRIDSTSALSKMFNFEHFNVNQINDVLMQSVQYIGKQKTLNKCCKQLEMLTNMPSFEFLKYLIDKHSDMLPNTNTHVTL